MCEMLAGAWDEPVEFDQVAPLALGLESIGIAGWGSGVAWLDGERGLVRVERGLHRFGDEVPSAAALRDVCSTRFLVHLRRPNRLSTVQLADTQPFVDDDGSRAFCHNGFLERAEEFRPRYAEQLLGRADSEVGWRYFRERLAAEVPPREALRDVHETFGGTVNLGYLTAAGDLLVHAGNRSNPVWEFGCHGGRVAATSLHSADESVFDLVFTEAVDRHRVTYGEAVRIGASLATAPASAEAARR